MVYFQCCREWKGIHSGTYSWTFCLRTRGLQEIEGYLKNRKRPPFWNGWYCFTPSLFLPWRNEWKMMGMQLLQLLEKCRRKECVLPLMLLLLWFWLQWKKLYLLWPLIFKFPYFSFSSPASFRRLNRREKPTQECVSLLLLRSHVLFVYIPLSGWRIEHSGYLHTYINNFIKYIKHFVRTTNESSIIVNDISIQLFHCQYMF